jgi:hypothetical protein
MDKKRIVMSEFTFSCPLCQQDIVCDEQYHGQQLQCPICQGEITAPEAETKLAGALAIKTPVGPKHTPTVPGLRKPVVVEKKSGLGKMVAAAGGVLVLAASLFCVARFTPLKSHLPAFLGGEKPARVEAASAGAASGPSATKTEPAAATPEAPPLPPPTLVWMTNLANAVIPTNAAYGKITTNDFKYDSARVDNGILVLRQGKGALPDMELGVFFGLKAGESLAGKSIDVAAEARVAPRVWKKWKATGKPALQQKVYSKGYAMKLQFGEVREDKVTGKIYLCLPDEEQSVVAGSFAASVGSALAVQPTLQTAAPAAPQMSEQLRKRSEGRTPARP